MHEKLRVVWTLVRRVSAVTIDMVSCPSFVFVSSEPLIPPAFTNNETDRKTWRSSWFTRMDEPSSSSPCLHTWKFDAVIHASFPFYCNNWTRSHSQTVPFGNFPYYPFISYTLVYLTSTTRSTVQNPAGYYNWSLTHSFTHNIPPPLVLSAYFPRVVNPYSNHSKGYNRLCKIFL